MEALTTNRRLRHYHCYWSPEMTLDEKEHGRHLQFRFYRTEGPSSTLPASILIQTLDTAQRVIWLIALGSEGRDIKSRARIPSEIEQRYQLKCEIPRSGSYFLPAFLEPAQAQLIDSGEIEHVLHSFSRVLAALINNDRGKVEEVIPDSTLRKRVLDEIQHLGPKVGSGWSLELASHETTLVLDGGWQALVKRVFASASNEPDWETVNGELIEVHFRKREIVIAPIGMSRTITVHYPEELEETLLTRRRSIIQVTGRVTRDDNEELKGISDVESIVPLDLSPLEIHRVESGGVMLQLKKPLLLKPDLAADNPHLLMVAEPRLGIDVFAGTVNDLVEGVADDLVMLWRNYAKAPDAVLTLGAQALKKRLLNEVEEVPVGS